jgi:hypothetical protein
MVPVSSASVWYVPADCGFLCGKVAVLKDRIKEISCRII